MTTNPIGEKGECCSSCKYEGGGCAYNYKHFCHTKTEVQKQIEAIGTVGAETAQKMQTEDMGGLSKFYPEAERLLEAVYAGLPHSEARHELITSLESARSEAKREEKESKDGAYRERDMLVCALSKLFPSYLARHSGADKEWENDWRWIVYIELPTGQVSWHIHDSEREWFNHLQVRENNWDGHNSERKYERLQALSSLNQAASKE